MSIAKEADPAKLELTKAIETRVERMDMAGLIELATALKVPVPVNVTSLRMKVRRSSPPTATSGSKVLKGNGLGPIVSAAEGSRLLDAITIDDETTDWAESELLGAGDLSQRLNVARGTIDNWRKAAKIVALRKGLRNFVYPVRQFERRRPVDGLDKVISFFPSQEEAWEWLVAPNRMTEGSPPIEKLREHCVPMVVGAAEGALDYA